MSVKKILRGSLVIAIFSSVAGFASPNPEAMRAASAVQNNTKLASSITLTKDSDLNIIGFHVNGVSPTDADILLKKDPAPLSTEFTIILGENREGGSSTYMLPTNVATAHVVESISKDLVNAGAITLQITKQNTGRPQSQNIAGL